MTLQEYMASYYEKYNSQITHLSQTLFDPTQRPSWFETLKRMTKYHNFMKRDGSFARSCFVDGKLVTGR